MKDVIENEARGSHCSPPVINKFLLAEPRKTTSTPYYSSTTPHQETSRWNSNEWRAQRFSFTHPRSDAPHWRHILAHNKLPLQIQSHFGGCVCRALCPGLFSLWNKSRFKNYIDAHIWKALISVIAKILPLKTRNQNEKVANCHVVCVYIKIMMASCTSFFSTLKHQLKICNETINLTHLLACTLFASHASSQKNITPQKKDKKNKAVSFGVYNV